MFQREHGKFSWVWFLDLGHLGGHNYCRVEYQAIELPCVLHLFSHLKMPSLSSIT